MKQLLRVGIGGPVGSGKTALVNALCRSMRENYSIANISLWFKMMHETENLKRPHMWNTHSLSLERLSNIACQDSAFSSIATLDYVQKGILSKQSIIECKSELLEQKVKLEKISNRILK